MDEGVMVAQVQNTLTGNGASEYRPLNTLQFPWIDLRRVAAMADLRRSLRPLAIADAQTSVQVYGLRPLFAMQQVASALLVPLVVNGEMIGMLSVDALRQRRTFAADDVEVAHLIAALGAPAIAAARKLADERRASREEERARIRHDLHNLRGIMNSTIVVDLQLMEDMLDRGEYAALAGEFRVVRNQLSFMHNQFGILMLDLHDPVLYEEGLVAAIDNYIAQSANLSRHVSFETEAPELARHLSLQVQHVVYRIAQEAITNACRHGIDGSPAGHVEVRLLCRDTTLDLVVQDNGRGFDPRQAQQGSLGLNIMRQWAADMRYKADLDIDSTPGAGTCVRLCVDLSQAQFADMGD
jgi:signal transduction histidine kinase